MAGSLVWVTYESDTTQEWAVKLDETNVKLTGFGFSLGLNTTAAAAGRILSASRKRPITMRYALIKGIDQDDKPVSRKLYVGTNGATAWINPTTVDLTGSIPDYSGNDGGFLTDVKISALIGEKRYLPAANDTGIIDGTEGDT